MSGNGDIIRHQDNGGDIATVERGSSATDTMGSEIARTAEAGTAQLEASARAEVQAQYFLARQFPRNWDQVEQRLLKECKRPGFANSAWWILPIGGDPKKFPAGLSIRFAEAAMRVAGNIDVQQMVVRDDQIQRIVRIKVKDLESNFGYTSEIIVDKTVERKNPSGREVLSYRQNSDGKLTYLVAATEQEIALKQGSAVSKAIRTNGLRLIDGDILDSCKRQIMATREAGAQAEDPEAARKVLLASFAEINVMPTDIAKLIEHNTDHFLPAERDLLRGVYAAIKNGVATWKEVMEAKFGAAEGAEESEGAKKVKEALAKRGAKQQQSETSEKTAEKKSSPETEKTTDAKTDAPKTTNPDAPSATTTSNAPGPTETSTKSSPSEPRRYTEFPDPPAEDGVTIYVKDVAYVSREGAWRKVDGKADAGPKKGTLNFD